MRAFKQYLTESHRTYDFRVRIADTDLTQEVLDSIERGLSQFDLADMSNPSVCQLHVQENLLHLAQLSAINLKSI